MLDFGTAFTPDRLPGWTFFAASAVALVAIGDPRHASLRPWRWLWLYLLLNACFNFLGSAGILLFSAGFVPKVIANVGRFLYIPPLLLGLAAVVGQPKYRTFARVATIVLVAQLLVGLKLSGGWIGSVPTIRTSITFLLIAVIAAVGVLARLPRVRGAIWRDPPMIALIATLCGYATQSAYAPIQAVLTGTPLSTPLAWVRAIVWIGVYALWWHAFREARRQARPT